MSVPVHKHDRILIVADDQEIVLLVKSLTSSITTSLTVAASLGEGIRLAAEQRFDVIILDHVLPDGVGLDRVSELLSQERLRPILYTTAHSNAATVIEVLQRGAFDCLTRPRDAELLKQRLQEALEYRRLTRLPVLVDRSPATGGSENELVGCCPAMHEVYKCVGRLAALDAPVLIEGELGTGKATIARAIHHYGPRRHQAFVKISGAELSARLQRDEAHPGSLQLPASLGQVFQPPAGGTLLVEELAELSTSDQSRLFKGLQREAVSGAAAVRLILSTSIPSQQLLEKGQLRRDLYYFLCPYTVRVPALRERGEDFERLVAHFMQQLTGVAATTENQGPARVSSAAMGLLRQHDWPGNLAQLKSVLQSVLLESQGAVLETASLRRALDRCSADGLPRPATPVISTDAAAADPPSAGRRIDGVNSPWNLAAFVRERLRDGTDRLYADSVAELEQSLLALVLQYTRGNQAQAAKHLGITRTSLRKKIALANIDVTRIEASS